MTIGMDSGFPVEMISMLNRKLLMIILCFVLMLAIGCQSENNSSIRILGHTDSSPFSDGEWSDELAEQANLVLKLSTQNQHETTLLGDSNGMECGGKKIHGFDAICIWAK
jgi:hypothetical protein